MASSETPNEERRWWSKRWWSVMESIGIARRLERGKRYARAECLLSLEFDAGRVRAEVQGSRYDPYIVEIAIDPFSDEKWHDAVRELATQALFSAKLLSGEMPENIEDVFAGVGVSLSRARPTSSRCRAVVRMNSCRANTSWPSITCSRKSSMPIRSCCFAGEA